MSRGIRAPLLCGAVAGPLFVFVVLVQSYTVPGFDPRLDHLSLLSLGPWGFVQIANFALCGILNLIYAQGLWRLLHGGPSGTFAPIFIAIYGLGLVTVGVFTTDPARGFPPGSLTPTTPSWHGAIHALVAIPVFVGDAAALAVMIRYFISRHEPGWAVYVAASSLLMLVFFFISFTSTVLFARFLDLGVLVGWLGAAVVAIKLLNSSTAVATGRSSAT